MNRFHFWGSVILAALTAVLCGGTSAAQDTATAIGLNLPDKAPESSPAEQVSAIMQSMADLKSLSFELLLKSKLTRGDQIRETAINGSARLKGQDKLRLELRSGNEEVWLISDGNVQWVYMPPAKRYLKLGEVLPRAEFMCKAPGGPFEALTTWLADFLHGNLVMLNQAKEIRRLPDEPVGSEMCLVYEFIYDRFTLRALFTRQNPPVPRRLEADMSADLQDSTHGGLNLRLTASTEITGWQPNVDIADDLFSFTPPPDAREEGATKIKVGEDAPDFSLPNASGQTVRLADFKGKKSVVLDFWASWCGPCRMAMPKVNAVANALKDEPVAFYAVNLQETEDIAKRFIEKNAITLPVLYDRDGTVARNYGVEGIPFLVVIDANGKVAWIHNGYSEDLEKTLAQAVRKAIGQQEQIKK